VFACGLAVWQVKTGRSLGRVSRALCLMALALGCAVMAILVYAYVVVMKEMVDGLRSTATYVVLAVAALGLILFLLRGGQSRAPTALWPIAVSGILTIVALFYWDVRSPWTEFAESPAPPPPALAAFLPAHANVYWEGGLELLWFRLRRPNYYSCDQG